MEEVIMPAEDLEIEEDPKKEIHAPVVHLPPKAETFCTDWKCINSKVKLHTLRGDEVVITSLHTNV